MNKNALELLIICHRCFTGNIFSLTSFSVVPLGIYSLWYLSPLFHWEHILSNICHFVPLAIYFLWHLSPLFHWEYILSVIFHRCSTGNIFSLSSFTIVPLGICSLCHLSPLFHWEYILSSLWHLSLLFHWEYILSDICHRCSTGNTFSLTSVTVVLLGIYSLWRLTFRPPKKRKPCSKNDKIQKKKKKKKKKERKRRSSSIASLLD